MYGKILLSLDLHDEPTWRTALPSAVAHAKAFGDELHLVYVVPDLPAGYVSLYVQDFSEEKLMDEAGCQFAAFADEHLPGDLTVHRHLEEGSVYKSILGVAEKIGAGLIMMASHRPQMSDYLLGPNAAKVVRHADCSVLVVRD